MRRVASWTAMVLVFLIAGAVVNLAVAWGCVIYFAKKQPIERIPYTAQGPLTAQRDWAFITRSSGWFRLGFSQRVGEISDEFRQLLDRVNIPPNVYEMPPMTQHEELAPTWSLVFNRESVLGEFLRDTSQAGLLIVHERAAGWPLLSFGARSAKLSYCSETKTLFGGCVPKWIVLQESRALQAPKEWFPGVAPWLPWVPIWPGFVVNTALYAILFAVALVAPFKLRRFLRRRRGCCAACGYDLRGSPNGDCPECGSSETTRTQPAGITAADSGAV